MNKLQLQLFRSYLPYCLQRQSDGRYITLNREYKPLGLGSPGKSLPGMTPRVAAALSARGSNNVDQIWLYNDGCVPTESTTNMQAYVDRLTLLATL